MNLNYVQKGMIFMSKPVLGVQLYTLRDYCKNPGDFKETIEFIKGLGCDLVQVSGVGKDEPIPADFQKDVFDETGVECCLTHTPIERILNETEAVITEHKLIGCRCIGLGWMAEEYRSTVKNIQSFLDLLEPALKKIKANGMYFNYHNHDFEFETLDNGQLLFDYMIENTDPEVFHFTPDVAWIEIAGQSAVEYLKRLEGRVDVCHFKDYVIKDGERKFVTLGEGAVDLKACYDLCIETGVQYIVYEQDCDWVDEDAKKATVLSFEYMKSLEG